LKIKSMMKKLPLIILFACNQAIAQTANPTYANIANMVSQTNVTQIITDFQALGVKGRNSAVTGPLVNTLNYLKAKYTAFGYTAAQTTEQSFTNGAFTNKNLIITKTGTVYPNTFVIICAHYDTFDGTTAANDSPGADDNGSGTAALLEVARLIKDIPTEYSIKFIHFSGEENGLIGSTAYKNNVVNATVPKMDIRLLLNIDGIGNRSTIAPNTVLCERDEINTPSTNNAASNTFNNQMISYVDFYSDLTGVVDPVDASDYIPFQTNGEVVIGLYESGHKSSQNHNSQDVLANMDPTYTFQVIKATVGSMLHFAVASPTVLALPTNITNTATTQSSIEPVLVYPNPASDNVTIKTKGNNIHEILIYDCSGRLVKQAIGSSTITIDIKELNSATYIFIITNKKTGQRFAKEVVKQ
jgi:aminopeptidase YwaD